MECDQGPVLHAEGPQGGAINLGTETRDGLSELLLLLLPVLARRGRGSDPPGQNSSPKGGSPEVSGSSGRDSW